MSLQSASVSSSAAARDPLWRLSASQALHLDAAEGARWLRLYEGELWVTADGRLDAPPPEDWWLRAGELLRLPPGTSVLAQAWPAASFELLEEPQR
jgi:hypothetical protein